MAIHFLFPAHPLQRGGADPHFSEQAKALEAAGFKTSLIGEGTFKQGKTLKGMPANGIAVYRGWMVKPNEYQNMVTAIEASGNAVFTPVQTFLSTHYLPNWYDQLTGLTPETLVFPPDADLAAELRKLAWDAYFIKDYVKSLKAEPGAIVRHPDDAPALLAAMRDYRGEIEGGICVRRVEPFVADSERRFFVLNGKPYGDAPIPEIVGEVVRRIKSPFYSIDVIRREDGVARVVEIGDGQVSDLVGWSCEAFANMWSSAYGS